MSDILMCNVKDCAVYDIGMTGNCARGEDGEYPNTCYRYWKNLATLEKQRREAAEEYITYQCDLNNTYEFNPHELERLFNKWQDAITAHNKAIGEGK